LENDRAFVVDLTQRLVGYKSTNPNFMTNPEASLEWHLASIHFPPVSTAVDHPLVQVIREPRELLGLTNTLSGFVAVTDAAFYAGAGITPVIYGPAGAVWHSEDEYVDVASLTETAKVCAGVILRWCGFQGA
jgi:acetylornithine deacetylase/succinyl-diaminopimelate desuccinylase-like protein